MKALSELRPARRSECLPIRDGPDCPSPSPRCTLDGGGNMPAGHPVPRRMTLTRGQVGVPYSLSALVNAGHFTRALRTLCSCGPCAAVKAWLPSLQPASKLSR
jgi:hypothetical protein